MRFVAVEGNIGSGKTSLAKRLSDHFKAVFIPEEFEENPFLELFYQNPGKYAFALEYSFFLDRVRQLRKIDFSANQVFISDYFIEKCLWFAKINLSPSASLEFSQQFSALSGLFPQPEDLIVLHLPLSKIKDNINKRGRAIESQINSAYLSELNLVYQEKPGLIGEMPSIYDVFLSDNSPGHYDRLFEICVEIISGPSKNQQVRKTIHIDGA